MKVLDAATKSVVTIGPEASVLEAARMMREHHVGTVVIVEETRSARQPIGVITDRDIVVNAVAQGFESLPSLKVEDIAAQELLVAEADQEVWEVARAMLSSGVRRMPVISPTGALVGIVTYDDLMAWMSDQMADFARLFSRQQRREKHIRR